MARRPSNYHVKCGHEGCRETAFFEAMDRDHYLSLDKNYGNGKWRCVRHSQPDEVLSAENPRRVYEITSRQEAHGRYFGSFGFASGPGFKAFANDFPAGATLRVTAEIIMPATPADPA